jgi:uncharacterized protein YbjT (DUF2867 family)
MMSRLSSIFAALCLLMSPMTAAAQSGPLDGPIIVFGANGQLGAEVMKSLVGAGKQVTAFVRPSADLKRLDGLKFETITGDVLVDADVAKALQSKKYAVVVDALGRSEAGPEFFTTSAENIVKWAKATGVRQFILHGSVGAGKSRAIYPDASWPRMKNVLLAKEAGENALIASGVPYTIIRNAQLLPNETKSTGQPKLYEGENKFGAITRTGLGKLTLDCTGNAACLNKIYHGIDEGLPMR